VLARLDFNVEEIDHFGIHIDPPRSVKGLVELDPVQDIRHYTPKRDDGQPAWAEVV
jgi:hypothetical protein